MDIGNDHLRWGESYCYCSRLHVAYITFRVLGVAVHSPCVDRLRRVLGSLRIYTSYSTVL